MEDNNKVEIGKIYEDTFDFTYRFVYSRVGNKSWTEEIVSETYLTFVEVFDNYDKTSKPSTFVIGIALNKIRQFYRKNKLKLSSELGEDFFEIITQGLDSEEVDQAATEKDNDREVEIKNLLSTLPEKYRKVLELRFLQGHNTAETAEKLGINVGNVRTMQLRALKKLKQL